jgi:hypothetical protein
MKKLKATALGESGDESMEEQILKFLHADEQTATSKTIRGSFRKAGLYPDVGSRTFRVPFDEEKPRNNAEFKKL